MFCEIGWRFGWTINCDLFPFVASEDYAARIRNLPQMDGTEPVEDELKKRVSARLWTMLELLDGIK